MNPNQEAPMVCREKYWEEKGIEDKVESCGTQIEQLHRRFNELERQLMLLSKHQHIDGEMVVPIKDKEYALESRQSFYSPINRGPK